MRPQDAPGDTPRFEQAVAQQHRVADGPPYRPFGVVPGGDTLNEYRVDITYEKKARKSGTG